MCECKPDPCTRRPALPGDRCCPAHPAYSFCLPHKRAKLSCFALHHCADAAVAELRKKGLAAASKKASRHAAEGLVGLAKGDGVAAVVEVRIVAVN